VWYLDRYWMGHPDVYRLFVRNLHGFFHWYWIRFLDWNWNVYLYMHWNRAWYLDWIRPVDWNWNMNVVRNGYWLGNWNRVGLSDRNVFGDLNWYSVGLRNGNLLGDGVNGVDVLVLDGIDVMLSVDVGDVSLTASQSVSVSLNVRGRDWSVVPGDQGAVAETVNSRKGAVVVQGRAVSVVVQSGVVPVVVQAEGLDQPCVTGSSRESVG